MVSPDDSFQLGQSAGHEVRPQQRLVGERDGPWGRLFRQAGGQKPFEDAVALRRARQRQHPFGHCPDTVPCLSDRDARLDEFGVAPANFPVVKAAVQHPDIGQRQQAAHSGHAERLRCDGTVRLRDQPRGGREARIGIGGFAVHGARVPRRVKQVNALGSPQFSQGR